MTQHVRAYREKVERAVPIALADRQACPNFYKGNVTARNGSRVAPCEAVLLFLLCFRAGMGRFANLAKACASREINLIDYIWNGLEHGGEMMGFGARGTHLLP